jgi:hypothetical protein
MKHRFFIFLSLVTLLATAQPMMAGSILYELLFNQDGAITDTSNPPGPITVPAGYQSTLDLSTGLGDVRVLMTGAGAHYFVMYIDLELGNDYGSPSNDETADGFLTIPAYAVLSGQIDDAWLGSIWGNANGNTLDNTNHVMSTPSDVAMALAWGFTLDSSHAADIRFHISNTLPAASPTGYLNQHQPEAVPGTAPAEWPAEDVYFWTTMDIIPSGSEPEIPEPGTVLLLGGGLAALLLRANRRRAG